MIRKIIQQAIHDATGQNVDVVKPKSDFGDYAVFIKNLEALNLKLETLELPKEIEKIEITGNYVNFFLTNEFLQSELVRMSDATRYTLHEYLEGQTVMVEYTDPNPFKKFHIGHLMSNAIGESLARLYEASGAKVLRVTWQGDVGMHIAMAVWGMQQGKDYLGEAYAFGSAAYRDGT